MLLCVSTRLCICLATHLQGGYSSHLPILPTLSMDQIQFLSELKPPANMVSSNHPHLSAKGALESHVTHLEEQTHNRKYVQ